MQDNVLNEFQRKALEAYQEGVFAYIAKYESQAEIDARVVMSEDPILAHLMATLSTKELCHTAADAKKRVASLIGELVAVLARL